MVIKPCGDIGKLFASFSAGGRWGSNMFSFFTIAFEGVVIYEAGRALLSEVVIKKMI